MTTLQNGTAPKTTTAQVNGTAKPQTAATEIVQEVKKIIPVTKELPSIQTRLAKFQELNKILERREEVAEALEELTNFYIASTGTGCKLIFTRQQKQIICN